MAFCDFTFYQELQITVTPMEDQIIKEYGNRLRIRVCGLCWDQDKLLVANHRMHTTENFWAPVGGGVEFGESVLTALVREFKEEANITIQPGNFLFGCEYLKAPFHAIELFFDVAYKSGNIALGGDPESPQNQILKDLRYLDFMELMALDPDERHGIFRVAESAEDLKKLSGFYII